jgi:hypothetical protein
LKKNLFFVFIFICGAAKGQKIDSIYINLYTDSLKKGTYNYINVDGLLSNGKYIPLDSNHVVFSSSYGKFYGNSLWIENAAYPNPVAIRVALRKNPSVQKDFVMFIKTKEDEELKSSQELMNEMQHRQGKKQKS